LVKDLTELKERVEFAGREIHALDLALQDYIKSELVGAARPTQGRDTRDFFITQKTPVPVPIKSRVGTITNELRACLDGLAVLLAIRNGETEKGVYFPMATSEKTFEGESRKKIKNLSECDRDTIAALKPYRGGHSWLWPLHEIDRIRKHLRLSGFAGASNEVILGNKAYRIAGGGKSWFMQCAIGGVHVEYLEIDTGHLKDGETEHMFATGVPLNLSVQAIFAVGFLEPEELRNQPMTDVLKEFAKATRQVIDLFDT
jgi:hypothetical protein